MNERTEELASLLALDALEPDEQPDAELELGTFALELAPVTAALADAVAATPPTDLRDDVLATARARRTPGTASSAPDAASPVDAFRQTVDELHALLLDFDIDEWNAPAHPAYGRVRDLVAHLIGIEQLALGWLGVEPPVDPALALDHVAGTAAAVAELRDVPTDQLLARWYEAARRIADLAAAADQDHVMQVHDLPANAEGMLVLRTFEVWAHTEDVAHATGRSLPGLDGPRAALMSQRLVESMPFGFALQATELAETTVRLVLTGTGGGTYDVPLQAGATSGAPNVTIVADVVELCRVAARRVQPDELEMTVEGDETLVPRVLVAAGAFSRD